MIEIHTDGACSGNPGPGGWGAIIREGSKQSELSGGEAKTTNNRMEMMAAIEALNAVDAQKPIKLFTDSTYLKDGLTKWLTGWKRNGWKTANKKPVKNRDLWERLDALTEGRTIEWHWVKGHSGDPLNERADALARQAIPGNHKPQKKSDKANRLQYFFLHYGEAFTALDQHAIVDCWAFPALISAPEKSKNFPDPKPFLENLEKLLCHYVSLGMAQAKATVKTKQALSKNTSAVQVEWVLFDQSDKELARWTHGYVLRLTDQGWRIFTAIADEEVALWSHKKAKG